MAETLETDIGFGYFLARVGTVEYPLPRTQVDAVQLDVVKKLERLGEIPRDTSLDTEPEAELIRTTFEEMFIEVVRGISEEIKKVSELSIEWCLDDRLKEKIKQDENLGIIITNSIQGISTYLDGYRKAYKIRAQLWRDIELPDWEENVITVEIVYKTHEEKMRIWKDLCDLIHAIDPEVTVLIDVRKLE